MGSKLVSIERFVTCPGALFRAVKDVRYDWRCRVLRDSIGGEWGWRGKGGRGGR